MDEVDVVVIGGSFAGLAAALYLARARRPVVVLDSGLPRNRFASQSHGVFALDGRPGVELLSTARSQLAAYPTARFVNSRVRAVSRQQGFDHFSVESEDKQVFRARRLILATGLKDTIPEIPGINHRWGTSVFHCPYCDGYEAGRGPLGVVATLPLSIHFAKIVAEWGPVTFYVNRAIDIEDSDRADLARRGIEVEDRPVAALEGPSDASLEFVRLADGARRPVKALFIVTLYRQAAPFASDLGCAMVETPRGPLVQTDDTKLTTIRGVYAAGDMARPTHSIPFATADGVTAGVSAHQSLILE